MDEVLKSEIFLVIYEKQDGVSLEEFAGLFHQVHGYNFNLSKYGYSSLKKLLNDMNDLVELKTINRQHVVRCRSPSRHHVVVSEGNNSFQGNEQVLGVPSSSSGPSPGPVVRKTEQAQPTPLHQNHIKQVNNSNSATDKKSKETSKSNKKNQNQPAKNTYPAVSQINNPQPINCGSSSNEKTTAISKTTKSHGFYASRKPQIYNPVHARPAGNVAIAVGAPKTTTVSKTRQECNSNSSNPNRNVPALQNVLKTRVIESKATNGPKKKGGLLPTPKIPVLSGPFNFNCIVQPGIQSNMSYAAVCASNVNNSHFNHNVQQSTANNVRFNLGTRVNSTNVNQSYSRAEPRTSIHSSSIIKENIQVLLAQHVNGLSVFQLQKLYLFTFRQPLKFKGSITLKQLLLELKDVVKIEGVGVQMLVFPVNAEIQQTTAANGDHDAALQESGSLFSNNDFQEEVVLNPHSSDSLKTQNDERQEATLLPRHDDQMLASGKHLMDSMKGFITNVEKLENKIPVLQNMQNVKNIPSNAQNAESPREELSISASDVRVLPNQVNEKPPHKAPPSAQKPHQTYNSQDQEKISLRKNAILKKATSKNGSSQNGPQASNLPQVILHSSGFSFVMGQQMDGPHNKADTLEKRAPRDGNNTKGPEHSQQMLSNSSSSMLLQDAKPQFSVLHVEDIEHLSLQPHNSMNTIKTFGKPESVALLPRVDFQDANKCNISESPPSHSRESLQAETVLVQMEKPFSVQKHGSQDRKKVEHAAYSSSNSQEKTPNPQIIHKGNVFPNASSNEKCPDVSEKTSQQEASVSPPTDDLREAKAYDLCGHSTEQAMPMLSDEHTVVNICTSKIKQDKPTLPTKMSDEFATVEGIAQTSHLSSRPGQEIVDPLQNIPTEPEISVAQGDLQDGLESISYQEDMNTWQTSQGQVCCIL